MSGDNAIAYLFLFALVVLGLRKMWSTTFESDGAVKDRAKKAFINKIAKWLS